MPIMNLASITTGTQPKPPRIVVYGPHGVGKTTFGANAPAPIFIRTEDGLATLRVPTFPQAREYGDVIAALGTLYTEPHPFQTLVLDSLDWLEPLVWAHTAFRAGQPDIEAFGFGKGYVAADEYWTEFFSGLDALRNKGMTVILLAHAEVKQFNSPETEPYDRYQIKLHKRAAALVQEWADVIGFAHYEVFTEGTEKSFNKKVTRGVGSGTRLLSVEERPAYQAKNRYSLPPNLPLLWKAFAEACAGAYAQPEAEAAEAETETAEIAIEEAYDEAQKVEAQHGTYAETLTD